MHGAIRVVRSTRGRKKGTRVMQVVGQANCSAQIGEQLSIGALFKTILSRRSRQPACGGQGERSRKSITESRGGLLCSDAGNIHVRQLPGGDASPTGKDSNMLDETEMASSSWESLAYRRQEPGSGTVHSNGCTTTSSDQ